MKNRSCIAYVICILIILVIGLFSSWGKAGKEAEPVRIGALLEFTGPLADYGPKLKQGIEFAMKEANWQVAGTPIKLIYEDSACDPAISIDKTKKLVEINNVKIIIGPLFIPATLGIGNYIATHKIISIAPKGMVKEAEKFGWVATLPMSNYSWNYPLGLYAGENLGYKTANTIYADYIAGYEFQSAVKNAFQKSGGRIITEQWAPLGTVDFGPYLSNIKKADVFFIWAPASDLIRLIKQYHEFGLRNKTGPIMISCGTSLWPSNMKELSDPILGTIAQVEYSHLIDTPLNKKFVRDFEAEYKMKPDSEHFLTYTGTKIALKAIEKAGIASSPEQLKQAVMSLKLDTPAGPFSFDSSLCGIQNIYIAEVIKSNGEYAWKPIYTYTQWGSKKSK